MACLTCFCGVLHDKHLRVSRKQSQTKQDRAAGQDTKGREAELSTHRQNTSAQTGLRIGLPIYSFSAGAGAGAGAGQVLNPFHAAFLGVTLPEAKQV